MMSIFTKHYSCKICEYNMRYTIHANENLPLRAYLKVSCYGMFDKFRY
jgi:hypothetical protein